MQTSSHKVHERDKNMSPDPVSISSTVTVNGPTYYVSGHRVPTVRGGIPIQEYTCRAIEKMGPALGTVMNEGNEFNIRRAEETRDVLHIKLENL